MPRPTKTYAEPEYSENGVSMYVGIGNAKGEYGFHFQWSTSPGLPLTFAGIFIPDIYIQDIFRDRELVRLLSTFPMDISIPDCQKLLKSWGFTQE